MKRRAKIQKKIETADKKGKKSKQKGEIPAFRSHFVSLRG